MRKIVLLPEPFGPSRPTISPGSIAKDTSLTARRGPYHLVTCCASTTGAMVTHKGLPRTRHVDGDVHLYRSEEKRQTNPGAWRGFAASCDRSIGCLFVVFRRVLLRLEGIRIVRHEHAGAFGIAHP